MKSFFTKKNILSLFLVFSACSPSSEKVRVPASGQATRDVREEFSDSVRAQAALYNLKKDRKAGSVIMLAYVENQRAAGVLKTTEDWDRARKRGFEFQNDYVAAVKALNDVRAAEAPAYHSRIKTVMDAVLGGLGAVPGKAGIGAGVAKPMSDAAFKVWEDSLKADVQNGTPATVAYFNAAAGKLGQFVVERMLAAAKSDSSAQGQYENLLLSVANVSVVQDLNTVLKNNPDFADHTSIAYIKDWIDRNSDENGNLKSPIPDEIVTKYLEVTRNLSKENQAALGKVLAGQAAQGKGLKEIKEAIDKEKEERRRSAQKLAQDREEEQRFQMKMAAGQAGISIVATVVGFSDPQKGRQIAGVGNAALSTASLIRNFQKGLDGGSTAKFMSSVIFSGHLLSIGVQVFSLFSGGGPSPEQLILDQINALKEDVRSLREMTESRFDQVDRSLKEILLSLTNGFENLAVQLKSGSIDVEAIRIGVENISKQNQRLDFNVRSQLKALAAREFNQKVDSCLLRKKIFEDSDAWMDSRLFEDCFLYFKTAASSNSVDQLSTVPVSADLLREDAESRRALAIALDNPIEELFPLLTRVAVEKFRNDDGTPMLPELAAFPFPVNPVAWALATQSFVDLGYASPQFLKKGEVDSVNAFFGPAETIKSISRILVANSRKDSRTVFWQELFLRYSKAIDHLSGSLEKNYQNWLEANSQGLDVFSPELPAAPTTSTRFGFASMSPCSEGVTQAPKYTNAWSSETQRKPEPVNNKLDAPAFEVLPELSRLAVAYGAGRLGFCYESIGYEKDHDETQWYRHKGNGAEFTSRMKDPYEGLRLDRSNASAQNVQRHIVSYGRPQITIRVSHSDPSGSEAVVGRIQLLAPKSQAPIAYARTSDKFRAEIKQGIPVSKTLKLKFHLFDERLVDFAPQVSKFGGVKSFAQVSQRPDAKGEQALRERLNARRTELGASYMQDVRKSQQGASDILDSMYSVELQSLLIHKFIQVAFPVSIENDEILRSMLTGTGGLMRQQRIAQILMDSNTLPEARTSISRDPSALQAHLMTKVLPAAVLNPELDPTLEHQLVALEDFRNYWNSLGSSVDVISALERLRSAVRAHVDAR